MFSKTRTWQRFACLILTLGLIFTVVPASAFADEIPVAGTAASISTSVEEESAAEGEKEPAAEEESAAEGEKEPAAEEEPAAEGEKEPAAEEEPAAEGEKEPAIVEEPVVEEKPVIEEEPVVEEEPAVESDAPAALSAAPATNGIGTKYTLSSESSEGVKLYYATRSLNWKLQYEISSLQEVTKDKPAYFTVLPKYVIYFYVSIPDGYQIDTFEIEPSENEVSSLPMSDGPFLEEFADVASQAINKGCQYGFYFSDYLNWQDRTITITTKPVVEQYTVSVNDGSGLPVC